MEIEVAKMIGAALALLPLCGVGIALGNIFSSLFDAIARNPSAKDSLMTPAYIGMAVTEAVALFALLISFLILYK